MNEHDTPLLEQPELLLVLWIVVGFLAWLVVIGSIVRWLA